MREIGIYVHIPFCKEKCSYCDFVSFPRQDVSQKEYITCLVEEIEQVASLLQQEKEIEKKEEMLVKTIYIGGGTPSYLDENQMVKVIEQIKRNFTIAKEAEITIEVNPGTVTKEKLEAYLACGINRLSIGLQSTQDRLLKLIGRIHSYEEFVQTYELARKCGFQNINVDLMIGLPDQKMEDVELSLQKIVDLNPEHISVYSLILEEGTRLEKSYRQGKLKLPEEILERKMYHKTKEILEQNGYQHYEISNFAKKGKQSKHNMDCWNQKEYLGFGLAAHSYYHETRYSNTEDLAQYIQNGQNSEFAKNRTIHEVQTKEAMQKEYMLLGLRKLEGVSISCFKHKFATNPIFVFRKELEKLEREGLIEIDLDTIQLTTKGLDLANLVWEEFV